jgi:uncharacterized membrane protein YeiB
MGIMKAWVTPLSLFLTVLLAKLTASFSSQLGIDASVWEAFFLLLGVISFIWLITCVVCLCTRWKEASLDKLLARIKNAEKKTGQ